MFIVFVFYEVLVIMISYIDLIVRLLVVFLHLDCGNFLLVNEREVFIVFIVLPLFLSLILTHVRAHSNTLPWIYTQVYSIIDMTDNEP